MVFNITAAAVVITAYVWLFFAVFARNGAWSQHKRDLRRWKLLRTAEGRFVLAIENLSTTIPKVMKSFQDFAPAIEELQMATENLVHAWGGCPSCRGARIVPSHVSGRKPPRACPDCGATATHLTEATQ